MTDAKYPLTTTLNRIWNCNPCDEGKERALKAAGKDAPDDEPITYAQIVEAVGLSDALWCCNVEPQYEREWRLFAAWCARRVQYLMEDQRSINALDVAERYARGEATNAQLATAWAAAREAWAANAAIAVAASSAAKAARDTSAANAAMAAAMAARNAWDTNSVNAAMAVAAASAARDTSAPSATWAAGATSAAWDTGGVALAAQRTAFIQLVTDGTLPPC